jgi:hypothetical protein
MCTFSCVPVAAPPARLDRWLQLIDQLGVDGVERSSARDRRDHQ